MIQVTIYPLAFRGSRLFGLASSIREKGLPALTFEALVELYETTEPAKEAIRQLMAQERRAERERICGLINQEMVEWHETGPSWQVLYDLRQTIEAEESGSNYAG